MIVSLMDVPVVDDTPFVHHIGFRMGPCNCLGCAQVDDPAEVLMPQEPPEEPFIVFLRSVWAKVLLGLLAMAAFVQDLSLATGWF